MSVKYNFTNSNELDSNFKEDMETLKNISIKVIFLFKKINLKKTFKSLVQASIKIMSGETELSNLDSLHNALEPLANIEKVKSSSLANSVRSLTVFLQGAIKQNLKQTEVISDLKNFEIDEEKSNFLGLVWKKYYVALSKTILNKNLNINPLIDLDWSFGGKKKKLILNLK
jgi:hypothetical protein